jgi:uroporphyrinogen-III synthase
LLSSKNGYIVALLPAIPLNINMAKEFIIITRPAQQANRFNQQLIDAKFKKSHIILSPISKIINSAVNPKITTSTILIFTSENALFNWNCDYKEAFSCYCVGLKTTETAKKLGLNAKFLGPNVQEFIKNFPKKSNQNYHYLRGKYVTFSLKKYLSTEYINIKETIIYEQEPEKINETTRSLLESKEKCLITIFSADTASTMANQLKNIRFLNLEFLCLSKNIKDVLQKQGFQNIRVAAKPTAESMVKSLIKVPIK